MATNMCRRLGRGLFCHSLSRGRHTRLVCSLPRVIFASNKHLQSTFPGSNSFEKMRPALVGVRMFADAGTALTRDEIQTRAMDVLKLFDKVNPEKVNILHFIGILSVWSYRSIFAKSNLKIDLEARTFSPFPDYWIKRWSCYLLTSFNPFRYGGPSRAKFSKIFDMSNWALKC